MLCLLGVKGRKFIWFLMLPYGLRKIYIVTNVTINMVNNIAKESEFKILDKTEALRKIIYWFLAFPNRETSLSDLARNTGVSKSNAGRIVKELVKEGSLKKEVLGRVWRISCNNSSPQMNKIKIPYNLELIYMSGVIEDIHNKFPNSRAVILFGSYRKGDDNEKSDVDVAVEVIGTKGLQVISLENIPNLGFRKNVPVNIHVFSRNKIDLNLFSNIANGIVLSGFLEVKP